MKRNNSRIAVTRRLFMILFCCMMKIYTTIGFSLTSRVVGVGVSSGIYKLRIFALCLGGWKRILKEENQFRIFFPFLCLEKHNKR